MFKDLQKGYQVYLLDKSERPIKYSVGSVVSVSPARFDERQSSQFGQPISYADRVIDLTIEFGGKTQTYTVPEQANVASAGMITLAVSTEPILNEVRAKYQESKNHIADTPMHEDNLKVCEDIMEKLSPAFADNKAQSERLDKLESSVGEIKTMVAQIVQGFSSAKTKPSKTE